MNILFNNYNLESFASSRLQLKISNLQTIDESLNIHLNINFLIKKYNLYKKL